ncbi:MAG: hypothetical protein Q8S00_13060 [Deltaproteobacteria bacterium]|nr:hypothetical protein [Deltaproteobacteria bacterium]
MDTIYFVDTTIRDGHQNLWAENMTTGMMLPIAEKLDNAGFEGIELISGSHLKKTVRELKEDLWERVRLMSKLITKTPLRLIAGRVNTFVKKRGHSEFLGSGVGHGVGPGYLNNLCQESRAGPQAPNSVVRRGLAAIR